MGTVDGSRNDCLIDTLRQKLGLVCPTRYVRTRLQEHFGPRGPGRVSQANFLTLDLHWAEVIRFLGEAAGRPLRPETFRIIAVDVEFLGNGDVLGEGPNTLHLARENGNHFVPLSRRA